ncbi:MAG: hypothetical protein RL291_422 [Pseudomonadota bacterium]|jgi:NAD(P)-dependent dehydrogenase (short-subunit alcohol dehydrogenase family)
MSDKRTILITGASTGIGLETARTFKARGWQVIASARKPEDLARLTEQDGVVALPLELNDGTSVDRFFDAALARAGGRIDALYNNAAFGIVGAMEDVTPDVLRQQLEVNVVGTHALTRRVVPVMRKQGHGRIVFCSSVLGLVTGRYRGVYSASKYALEAIADAYRYELDGTGIRVAIIEPGPIRTAFLASTVATFRHAIDTQNSPHADAYRRRMAEMENETPSRFKLGPEAVARAVLHAVESPRPKVRYRISPHTHAIALARRVLPGALLDRILMRA